MEVRGGGSSILVVTQLLQAEEELCRRAGDCWGWVLFIRVCEMESGGMGEGSLSLTSRAFGQRAAAAAAGPFVRRSGHSHRWTD